MFHIESLNLLFRIVVSFWSAFELVFSRFVCLFVTFFFGFRDILTCTFNAGTIVASRDLWEYIRVFPYFRVVMANRMLTLHLILCRTLIREKNSFIVLV